MWGDTSLWLWFAFLWWLALLSIFWPSVCFLWRNVCNLGLIPGLGTSPGEGNGYPLQHSSLENSMERGAWQATQSMGSQRVMHDWATFTSLFRSTAHWKKNFVLLSSMSHLYILDDNPSSFTSFTNIFSHSIGFCILLVFSFGLP